MLLCDGVVEPVEDSVDANDSVAFDRASSSMTRLLFIGKNGGDGNNQRWRRQHRKNRTAASAASATTNGGDGSIGKTEWRRQHRQKSTAAATMMDTDGKQRNQE